MIFSLFVRSCGRAMKTHLSRYKNILEFEPICGISTENAPCIKVKPLVTCTASCTTYHTGRYHLLTNVKIQAADRRHWYCTNAEDVSIDVRRMKWLQRKERTVVIDVREPEEIESFGGIPGAVNLPMGDIEECLEMPPHKFQALYNVEQPDPETSDVVFVCARGRRSMVAVHIAKQLGFQRCWSLDEGYGAWKEALDQENT